MAKLERSAIRELADRARHDSPAGEELVGACVADPILVRDPRGEPGFWLVPFLRDHYASGFATVTLSGTVQRIGTFGSGALDSDSWIPTSYFVAPPEDLLSKIQAHYPGSGLSDPVFSYDRVPSRWGWRLQVDPPTGDIVFIAPRDWYALLE